MDDCVSCGEDVPADCPESERPCGHRCNHSWSHDQCDWCGQEFGESASAGLEAQSSGRAGKEPKKSGPRAKLYGVP